MSDVFIFQLTLSRAAHARMVELTEGATGDSAVSILERAIAGGGQGEAPEGKPKAAKKAPAKKVVAARKR